MTRVVAEEQAARRAARAAMIDAAEVARAAQAVDVETGEAVEVRVSVSPLQAVSAA